MHNPAAYIYRVLQTSKLPLTDPDMRTLATTLPLLLLATIKHTAHDEIGSVVVLVYVPISVAAPDDAGGVQVHCFVLGCT